MTTKKRWILTDAKKKLYSWNWRSIDLNSDKKKTNITEIVFRVAGILLLAFYFISLVYLHFNQILYHAAGFQMTDEVTFLHMQRVCRGSSGREKDKLYRASEDCSG